ncbi:dynamin family protein [Telluria beijingensis]|uniref:dynamin family protein n=1 Tax=Telluria beijingensis TaxID=3068633 RepID=UPI0027963B02|nr:dynamin family protein [Massilia sp. REN29]
MTTLDKDMTQYVAATRACLPPALHGKVDDIASGCRLGAADLRLIVLGGFSVGKSTLINMLAGGPWLHAAREEATALPTFIEYGPAPAMALVGVDGSVAPVDAAGFRAATSDAPDGAACATLALPQAWLQGVTLVDLPGLGSVDAARQQYTAAQVLQADAVLYLLDPRGPAAPDIDALRLVAQYGKRVKVVVARWDEVVLAQARGEVVPNLETWAAQIESQAGLRVRLAGVSRDGLGREELLEFVGRARGELDAIRLRRFQAELRPVLQNALGGNAQAQRACALDSEDAASRMHGELMERKQELLALKGELYARQQQERDAALDGAETAAASGRAALERALGALAEPVLDDQDWEGFEQAGGAALRGALAALAATLSEQSRQYGELALPEGQVERVDVRVPPMPAVDVAAFVETGRLATLQQAVLDKQHEMQAAESRLESLPVVASADAEDALLARQLERNRVAVMALPRITEVTPGNGAAAIGRVVGELADIGVMFLNPALVGAKAGSLVATGAKVAKATVDVKKVASVVSAGVQVAQAIRTNPAAGMLDKGCMGPLGNMQGPPIVPRPMLDKLKMLEALSLGYWGERIGMALGGAPTERQVVDPEALAQQKQALAQLDHEIALAQRELARQQDLLNERQLGGWALEQGRREIQRMEQEAAELARRRDARQEQAAPSKTNELTRTAPCHLRQTW